MKEILNLDAFVPKERIVQLGGREFDVSFIPSSIAFKAYNNLEVFARMEKGDLNEGDFEIVLDMIASILKLSQPDITTEWVDKHVRVSDIGKLIRFVLKPLEEMEETEKKSEGTVQE